MARQTFFALCALTIVLMEGIRIYSLGVQLLFLRYETFCQQHQGLRGDAGLVEVTATASYDYIVKRKGEEWELWDRRSILHEDLDLHCQWTVYKPALALPYVPSAPMCAHPRERDQTITGSVIDLGRWPDCDSLTLTLRDEVAVAAKPVHVEIGANIGCCIMQVLLTTNAIVYAFEPHPENLFHLTSTLINMHESYRNRVFLFPIALGEKPGFSHMAIHRSNAGSAQVGHKIGPKVRIERLDDILDPHIEVALVKMDAQGYECFIVAGMPMTLNHTKNLVFEVEARQLNRFTDCTPASLVNSIKAAAFNITRMPITGKDDGALNDLPDFAQWRGGSGAIDLLAKKQSKAILR